MKEPVLSISQTVDEIIDLLMQYNGEIPISQLHIMMKEKGISNSGVDRIIEKYEISFEKKLVTISAEGGEYYDPMMYLVLSGIKPRNSWQEKKDTLSNLKTMFFEKDDD